MRTTTIILSLFLLTCAALADGLMRPSNKAYPGNFLRHRMTDVKVTMTGQVAQTTVYQEFVNEWTGTTDAVYSFPLPVDARATALYFWSNDTMYRAVLKVKEQATNPGTGEGGIDAQITAYLGPNGIRMLVPNIPAGEVQRIQIEYISLCRYGNGTTSYRYPLNTTDFSLYPVESFSFVVNVTSGQTITGSSITPASGAVTTQTGKNLRVSVEKSKIYLTSDLLFSYTAAHDSLTSEFYGVDNNTSDGHFVMLVKSPSGGNGADVYPKNVVFVLDKSSDIFGVTLSEAKSAIGECIQTLNPQDRFAIVTFDYWYYLWRPALSAITAGTKDSAITFLSSLSYSGGSGMQVGMQAAFDMFPTDTTQNIILLFSDGKTSVTPEAIKNLNTKKAAVMTVTTAAAAGRQRMELIAYQNYGIPALIAPNELVKDRVTQIFDRINLPVMKGVQYEIGSNVHDIIPARAPSLYKGSMLYFTGRYKNPGSQVFSIAGFSPTGTVFKDVPLTFPSDTVKNKFAESFWAKERIDEIERRIAVYGVTDSLKQADIAVSLAYGIRCQYTSFNAEKTNPVGGSTSAADAVEFTSGTMHRTSTGVQLQWSVAEGSAVREFHILRREKEGTDFRSIGTVSGTTFTFTDAGADGSGDYRIDAVTTSGRTVSLLITRNGLTPSTTSLSQNYPNPFNPSTRIRFELAQRQHAVLSICDVTGREIARPVDGVKEAGTHDVSVTGSGLSSGIYFYTLTAGAYRETRRMVLVK